MTMMMIMMMVVGYILHQGIDNINSIVSGDSEGFVVFIPTQDDHTQALRFMIQWFKVYTAKYLGMVGVIFLAAHRHHPSFRNRSWSSFLFV